MDQTLQNRNLENCSLNDYEAWILSSSITVHFLSSLSPLKNSLPCRFQTLWTQSPPPVGMWEEVRSKLGSKPAQLIHRVNLFVSEVHTGLLCKDKSMTERTDSRVFSLCPSQVSPTQK